MKWLLLREENSTKHFKNKFTIFIRHNGCWNINLRVISKSGDSTEIQWADLDPVTLWNLNKGFSQYVNYGATKSKAVCGVILHSTVYGVDDCALWLKGRERRKLRLT